MVGQLAGAALSAGASFLSGMFGNREEKKAQNRAFQYQASLNNQAWHMQNEFLQYQNAQVGWLNNRMDAWNREILDNHSRNETTHKQTDTTETSGSIDFARMVADAEKAGFNPLTVLRNGGAAGYSTSNVKTTSDIFTSVKVARDLFQYFAPPDVPQVNHPGQAPQQQRVYNPMGDALTSGLNAFLNFDRHADARAQLEMDIAKAQLANINSDTAMNSRRFAIPTWTGSGLSGTTGGFGGSIAGTMAKLGMGGSKPQSGSGREDRENAFPANSSFRPNQNYAAASVVEDNYGEIASNIYGLGLAVHDIFNNTGRLYNKSAQKALKTNPVVTGAGSAGNWLSQMYDAALRAYNNPALNAKGGLAY